MKSIGQLFDEIGLTKDAREETKIALLKNLAKQLPVPVDLEKKFSEAIAPGKQLSLDLEASTPLAKDRLPIKVG